MNFATCLNVISILTIIADFVAAQEPVVNIVQGSVRGIRKSIENRGSRPYSYVYAFLGIPYAKPPVGPLRFAAPERHPGWNRTTLYASEFGPACPQPDLPSYQTNEDCLRLNIWTPEVSTGFGTRHPVVFFLEGEGFTSGDPAKFTAEDFAVEGAVVVSANYRLNVLGFFCLEEPSARGNLGLLDQYLVLRWIRENIGNFGGDADRVTLLGHSGGAASAFYHMLSPRTRGLIHRIIAMSGSVTAPWAGTKRPREASLGIARSLGCSAPRGRDIVSCLQDHSVADLLRAFNNQYKNGNSTDALLPVVDDFLPIGDQYMPFDPVQAMKTGGFPSIPIITGVTTQEGIVNLYQWGDLPRRSFAEILDFFNRSAIPAALAHYGFKNKDPALAAILLYEYASSVSPRDRPALLTELAEFYSDAYFRAPHAKLVDLLSTLGNAPYVYVFGFQGPDIYGNTINVTGAAHGSELQYLFGPRTFRNLQGRHLTPQEDRVSQSLKSIFLNFATQGTPYPNFGPVWRRWSPEEKNYFALEVEIQRSSGYPSHRTEVWNNLLPILEASENNINDNNGLTTTNTGLYQDGDPSQPFRSVTYFLCAIVGLLLVLLVLCLLCLKRRAKERDPPGF